MFELKIRPGNDKFVTYSSRNANVKIRKRDDVKIISFNSLQNVNIQNSSPIISEVYDKNIKDYRINRKIGSTVEQEFNFEPKFDDTYKKYMKNDYALEDIILNSFDGTDVTIENCIMLQNNQNITKGGLNYLFTISLHLQRGKFYENILTLNTNIIENLGYEGLATSNDSDDFQFNETTGVLSGFIANDAEIFLTIQFRFKLAYGIYIRSRLGHDIV